MALTNSFKALWRRDTKSSGSITTSLSDVLDHYDLVDVNAEHGFAVVTEKKELAAREAPQQLGLELGSAAPSPFTSWVRQEYNSKLYGTLGLQQYDKMKRGDGTVRSTLRLMRTPILAAEWYMQPASHSTRDRNVADFVWKNLTEWMSISFNQFLFESTLMLDYGYYMFEKVFVDDDPRAGGMVTWKKLAPRHPMDVAQWNLDAHGGPNSVEMYPANTVGIDTVEIGIKKLLVMSFDKEAGNIQGLSVLRSAYKHWYYKDNLYKIDAIQKERHGIGIPIIKLPPNFTEADKRLADEMGRNLRTNERAHVVLPPNWDILFAKLEGQPVNALESVKMHNEELRANILAQFLNDGVTGASVTELIQFFLKATKYVADIVQDVINMYAIPQLVDYNWMRVGYPKLCARSIADQTDTRTLTFALRNLVGSQLLTPDDGTEDVLRGIMDLPPLDKKTARVAATPQSPANKPPKAGPPRQTPPSSTPPRSSGGRDGSGGK